MATRDAEILEWLSSQQDNMVSLLSSLVNVDSGSYDKEAVDAVGALLARFFAGHGLQTTVRPVADFGDTLLVGTAAVRRGAGRHNILLMGHRDTVFGKGEAARRPFHIQGNRAYGPGVADMKAGLVMNAFVLAAFQKFAPDVPQGITLNVGLVDGGSSTNTVAAKASGEVDVRFVNGQQRDRLIADIEAILGRSAVLGTTITFERKSESLPLAPTPENIALSTIYREAAASLGFETSGEFTGGCADSGIASSAGAPTVCATWPVGGKAHTEEEYILVETLSQRAAIVAASILRLHV